MFSRGDADAYSDYAAPKRESKAATDRPFSATRCRSLRRRNSISPDSQSGRKIGRNTIGYPKVFYRRGKLYPLSDCYLPGRRERNKAIGTLTNFQKRRTSLWFQSAGQTGRS